MNGYSVFREDEERGLNRLSSDSLISGEKISFCLDFFGEEGKSREGDVLSGSELIRSVLSKIPCGSGVYCMKDSLQKILYVGKAKNLRKRIASYAYNRGTSARIRHMILQTKSVDFFIARSEVEALLLESNLIKQYVPRYNVLLRDDKSFPSILISDGPWPGLFSSKSHSFANRQKSQIFGPFASTQAVKKTIHTLQRAFLIRTCRNSFFKNRVRPCLLYQIKRCCAPCTGEISPTDYAQLVDEVKEFLSGRSQKVKKEISLRMQEASDNLDFERAVIFRDRLAALSCIQSHQGVDLQGLSDTDAFAIHREEGQVCVQVFFFRDGQNRGGKAYFLDVDPELLLGDILRAFLAQFYHQKKPPYYILSSMPIEEEALLKQALILKADHKITISVPKRGQKKDIIDHTLQNAQEALLYRIAKMQSHKKLFEKFSRALGLKTLPKRVEVYDNSHTMGSGSVGVMIVAGLEGFIKNEYRKFNITCPGGQAGDDLAMMREMMTRRFLQRSKNSDSSIEKEEQDMSGWPDMILIDGGLSQLEAVKSVLSQIDRQENVFLLAIAKGKDRNSGCERFFLRDGKEIFFPKGDSVFHFLQNLRDEAHRFAVGSHRVRRKKIFYENPLDSIPNVGAQRKRALLLHFGTIQAISRASVKDLMLAEGISRSIAMRIYEHFH